MSGGVDSSATAALLLEQGYDVVGITLKLWPQDCVNRAEDKCCGPQAVTDARSVCHKLGIPYYLIDEAAEFQKHVIQYFADEYKAGRTPNPCVMCNQNLKFGRLIDRADQLGAEFIATGHFARVERASESATTVGQTFLSAGAGDLPVACSEQRTGKSGAPAGSKACPTSGRFCPVGNSGSVRIIGKCRTIAKLECCPLTVW